MSYPLSFPVVGNDTGNITGNVPTVSVLYSWTGVVRFVFVVVHRSYSASDLVVGICCGRSQLSCEAIFWTLLLDVVTIRENLREARHVSHDKASPRGGPPLLPYSPVPSLPRSLRAPIDA